MSTTTQPTTIKSENPKTYRMVAIDLDATLLQTESKTIADVQAAYLKSLSQRGFQICIATGRAASTVYEHLAKLETVEVVEPNESTTDTNTTTTATNKFETLKTK